MNQNSRTIRAAVTLGITALVLNYAQRHTVHIPGLMIGNVLLYISAMSLGLNAAIISLTCGLLPGLDTPDFGLISSTVTVLTVAYAKKRTPQIPSFYVVTAVWLLAFMPTFSWLESSGHLKDQSHLLNFSLISLGDILAVLVAGCLLENSNLWTFITKTPFIPSSSRLLLHILPLMCSVAVFLTLLIFGYTPHFSVSEHIAQVMLVVLAPTLIARALYNKVELGLLANRGSVLPKPNTFSGKNSEFWRRESFIGEKPGLLGDGTTAAITQAAHLSDQGICAINKDNSVSFVNKRFLELCKITSKSTMGKRIDTIGMAKELASAIIDLVQTSFERGPRSRELRFESAEKGYFFELSTLKPESLESSSLAGAADAIILTIRDISHRRTLETHLLQAQKLDSLGKTVSGLAHSFNNALTTIAGYASVALHQQDESQISKALQEILETTKSAGDLAKRLLAFAEGKPGTVKTLDLASVIEQHLALLKQVVGSSFELKFTRPEQALWVKYDANLVLQAITNVLINAKESYLNTQGRIELDLELEELTDDLPTLHAGVRPGKFARLRVRDFGCGMTAETLAQAFEPLFSTKKNSGHAGLGLSMAFATLRAHNGFMIAESRSGRGTAISLYFPIMENSPTNVDVQYSKDTEDLLKAVKGEKILLVEDDPQVLKLTSKMLESLGYQVESCSTATEALECAKNSSFTLALVDMVMPVMQGTELLKAIRDIHPQQAVLLMTGLGTGTEDETQTIYKPFGTKELSHAVRQAIASSAPKSRLSEEQLSP